MLVVIQNYNRRKLNSVAYSHSSFSINGELQDHLVTEKVPGWTG